MNRSRRAGLMALGCAAVLVSGCGTLTWVSSTMNRPETDVLGSSEHDTLTQHNDPQRSGAYLREEQLNPETVGGGKFARLFDWEVDGQIYTQPLYVSNLPYKGRKINMVVVATTNNSVYAFEAPSAASRAPPSETPLWHVGSSHLGQPLPYNFFVIDWGILGHNMKPQIGITATPVIDRKRGLVYVTAKVGVSDIFTGEIHPKYRLFALDLLTGDVVAGVDIQATYQGWDGNTTTFDAQYHLQRASLLEADDRIYLAFGSHQDTVPYHGWVLAYEAETLRFVNAYCTTCDLTTAAQDCSDESCKGGIWQAGGGPASDSDGHLYVMTANGSYDPDPRTSDRGNSFIKLDKGLNVIGSWTPAPYDCLSRTDADLGSAGPTYLKGQSVLVGGGKEGLLYALSADALDSVNLQPGRAGRHDPCDGSDPIPVAEADRTVPKYWSIQATPAWEEHEVMDLLRKIDDSVLNQGYHHIHGSPVQWTVHTPEGDRLLLYVSAERDLLRAHEFGNGFTGASVLGPEPKDTFHSQCKNSDHGMPGGFLTISADGDNARSGIVWAAMPRHDKNALNGTVPGVLRAYRAYPNDGGKTLKELWNSDSGLHVAASDCKDPEPTGTNQLGDFAKFVPPTVAEGKVYMSTFSHQLVVYGLTEAPRETYDAELELKERPPSAEPGSRIKVEITATNKGSRAWRADDGIRLGSQTAPADKVAPVEGPDALKLAQEVQPGGTYVFTFQLTTPVEEAAHNLSWRLVRKNAVGQQPANLWFGASTREWEFHTLQNVCSDLRDRAQGFVSQILNDPASAKSLDADIRKLRQDAENRKCSLHATVDPAMTH